MVSGSSIPEARAADAGLDRPGALPPRPGSQTSLFTGSVLDYAAHRPGQTISIAAFGCVTAGNDLDLTGPQARRYQFAVTMWDEDNAMTRAAVERRADLRETILGDLRAVPMTPRSVDIVHCCRLLDRISHTDILLSRLVDALRPGGLLLVRTADRQSAAGFLDRTLPRPLRGLTWRSLRPGQPGPYPAIYEPLTSARGLQAFVTRHGLSISGREATSALAGQRHPVVGSARGVVSAFTRGKLTAAHDELGFVIRKPEDRFARVL